MSHHFFLSSFNWEKKRILESLCLLLFLHYSGMAAELHLHHIWFRRLEQALGALSHTNLSWKCSISSWGCGLWELHSCSSLQMEMCQLDTSTTSSHSRLLSLQVQTGSRNGISCILHKLRTWLGLNTEAKAICCRFHQWKRHNSLSITQIFFATGGYTSVLSQIQHSNDVLSSMTFMNFFHTLHCIF